VIVKHETLRLISRAKLIDQPSKFQHPKSDNKILRHNILKLIPKDRILKLIYKDKILKLIPKNKILKLVHKIKTWRYALKNIT